MNQRDALLEGAKRCLVDKGYSHTTARDIATASGAHLGSIGYHFGSKDRLMNLAALELSSEWGDTLERVARAAGGATVAERLHTFLAELIGSILESRDVPSASLQALAQSQFDDELRQ
ncbi:MAG: TetR/AcrR family transcriptional regulator, partial [Stackebrandtia sp.]